MFQEWAGLDEGVADGAGADVEQFAEGLACADFPLVEDRGEDAASGSGESFTTASLVTEAFEAGGLERVGRSIIWWSSSRLIPVRAGCDRVSLAIARLIRFSRID